MNNHLSTLTLEELVSKSCALIPAYREANHIAAVVEQALAHCPNVVVIDDGSGDTTPDEAERAGATVLRLNPNQGKGAALRAGFDHATEKGYLTAITLDADGQHDPAEIPDFLRGYLETGIPVLTGNRMANTRDMPFVRRCTNRFMSWLLSRSMGQFVPDTQCGYRLYAAEVFPFLRSESTGFAAESEQLLDLSAQGVKVGSVPVKTIYGDEESKINPFSDTIKFFSMLRRYKKKRGEGAPPSFE